MVITPAAAADGNPTKDDVVTRAGSCLCCCERLPPDKLGWGKTCIIVAEAVVVVVAVAIALGVLAAPDVAVDLVANTGGAAATVAAGNCFSGCRVNVGG